MSNIMDYLNDSSKVTRRELVLGAIAGLMTGVVIGTYASRPKHPRHPHGAPGCPPPPMPPHGAPGCPPPPMPPHDPDEQPPMPPGDAYDRVRRPLHNSACDEKDHE